MAGYIVINGSYTAEENHVSFVADFDSLENAKRCCHTNIAEDYGYSSYDEFLANEEPQFDHPNDYGLMYYIGCSKFEHQEEYKVYELR